MKRNVLKVTSILLTVCLLLPLFGGAVQATSVSSTPAAEEMTLDPNSVPELLTYEAAMEAGHLFRVNGEEPQLNCVIFRNTDSSDTIYVFNEDVKYIDSEGVVRDKKNGLTRQLDGSYQNSANNVTVTYPATIASGLRVQSGGLDMQIIPAYKNNSSISPLQQAKASAVKTVSYADAFGTGTMLRFNQTYSGFSGEILWNGEGGEEVSFTVRTGGASILMENGVACVYLNGKKAGTFGEVCVYDAANRSAVGAMTVAELTANQTYRITVTIPAAFLEDTVYPVVAKPTFSVAAASPAIEKAVNGSGSALSTARTAVTFPGLEQIAGLLQKYRNIERDIESAKYVYGGTAENAGQEVELKSFVDSWKAGTPNYGITLSAASESGISVSNPETVPYLLLEVEPILNENNKTELNAVYQITNVDYDYAISYSANGLRMTESDTTTITQHLRIDCTDDNALLHQVIPLYNTELCMTGGGATVVTMNTNQNLYTRRWYIAQEDGGYRFYNGAGTYVLAYQPYEEDESVMGSLVTQNSLEHSVWNVNWLSHYVDIHTQETDSTCGPASALMLLDYYGVAVSETQIINYATSIADEDDEYPQQHNYYLTQTINLFLAQGGKPIRHTNKVDDSYSLSLYTQMLQTNISNGYLVMVLIKIEDISWFPYDSPGHFVVVSGVYNDPDTNELMAYIVDPHYDFPGYRVAPVSVLYNCSKAHQYGAFNCAIL